MSAASATPNASFLSAFGLTADHLATFLRDVNGFIAGGAALYWYLDRESPIDQDLDIWIPTKTQHNPAYGTIGEEGAFKNLSLTTLPDGTPDPACYAYDKALRERAEEFLMAAGYKWHSRGSGMRHSWESGYDRRRFATPDIPYHTNPALKRIIRTINDYYLTDSPIRYDPPTGVRKIQVIFYYGNADPLADFDLNICKIVVRPDPDSPTHFQFQMPDDTTADDIYASRMRVVNPSCLENLVRRIRKYYERGFHIVATVDDIFRPLTADEAMSQYSDDT